MHVASQGDIDNDAAHWYIQIHGPYENITPLRWHQFYAWMQADPHHAETYHAYESQHTPAAEANERLLLPAVVILPLLVGFIAGYLMGRKVWREQRFVHFALWLRRHLTQVVLTRDEIDEARREGGALGGHS
jgi:ferric-dicitrate binding protein FerR (iron transport regulator)